MPLEASTVEASRTPLPPACCVACACSAARSSGIGELVLLDERVVQAVLRKLVGDEGGDHRGEGHKGRQLQLVRDLEHHDGEEEADLPAARQYGG